MRIGGAGKWHFLSRPFWIFFCFISMKNNFVVHMRYYLFLHYGGFLQNLGKDFIPANMHMTVSVGLKQCVCERKFLKFIKDNFLYQIWVKPTFCPKNAQPLLICLLIWISILAVSGLHSDLVQEIIFWWGIFESLVKIKHRTENW